MANNQIQVAEARDVLITRALTLLTAKRTDLGPEFDQQITYMETAFDAAARELVAALDREGKA